MTQPIGCVGCVPGHHDATYLANNGMTGDPGLAVGEAVAAKIVTLRRRNPSPPLLPNFGENVVGKWRATQNHLGRRRYLLLRRSRLNSWPTFILSCYRPGSIQGPPRLN